MKLKRTIEQWRSGEAAIMYAFRDAKADILALHAEVERLRAAIQQTLDENGHLADGDNCTLIVLKRALKTPNAISQATGAAVCARSPGPMGYTAGDNTE